MIVTMKELLQEAEKKQIAVGAFNVGNLEMVEGAVRAAESCMTPIILQVAEKRLNTSPLELIGPMMVSAAKHAKVKVAVQLDHGVSEAVIRFALDLGFSSVMFDGSELSLEKNIRRSPYFLEMARKYGASFEAELGSIGGSEGGLEREVCCTRPEDAVLFCQEVKPDALAIAIGNAHGHYKEAPDLRFDILKSIRSFVAVPLVLHGGSGISFAEFRKAIRLGMRKINIGTASFDAYTDGARQYLEKEPKGTYFGLSASEADYVCDNVRRHIQVFNNEVPLETLEKR